MLKGYEDRTRYRRMLFYSEGYLSTTIEGLVAFEANTPAILCSLSRVLSG